MTDPAADIDLADLPPSLADLARLIGLSRALALARARPGVRIYVPLDEATLEDHWLTRLIGFEAAQKMVRHYGGDGHFLVPRAWRAALAARNRGIVRAYLAGASQRALALEHGLTERQICGIVAAAGARRASGQADLFEAA